MPVHTHSRSRYRVRHLSAPANLEITAEIKSSREDLGVFGGFAVHKIPARHHQSWIPHLVTGQSSSELSQVAGGNLNILAPRGSAKSTWLAIFAAWAIGHNPHIQIIYVGYSESVALKQSRIIKRIIESSAYRKVFPHIRPGDRWSDRDWEIDKPFAKVRLTDSDYTFYAVGITGAITSRRASLILCDDLIKSSRAIANADIREKMIVNWSEVLEPTLIPGGRVVSIGTRFRRDDIHSTEFTEANGFQVLEQKAIVNQESYWPERFPIEFLARLRKRSPVTFCYQYQNQMPPDEEEAIIKAEWIVYGDCPKDFDDLVLGVDLASSQAEKSDYTALVLVGRKGQRFYVIEAIQFRAIGNLEKIKRILEVRKKYGAFRLIFEKVSYQSSFEGDWRDEMKRRRITDLSIEPVIPRGDKDQRLEGVSGIFANGLVILNQNYPLAPLVDEVLRLTTDHDDLCDALVYALARLQRRSRKTLSAA
jgi:predicted phage terminase large subunit-like protein